MRPCFPTVNRSVVMILCLAASGCHTYEVRQFDAMSPPDGTKMQRAAVIMKTIGGDQIKQNNKLFTEQLIVSLQKCGIDVAERQKVEALLVDAALIEQGQADLTETERAKRLGRLLKADVIIYGDAIVNTSYYHYFPRLFFNSETRRFQLEQQANESGGGVVKKEGFPVLATHAIGLSMRAVETSTGEIIWVGYRFLASGKMVDEDKPETITNFDVVRRVSEEIINDLLKTRKL